jgi:hypothetical protein
MPVIEITDEELAFLQTTAKNLAGQNNRATAQPYYYVVRTWKKLVLPPGHGDKEIRYDHELSEEFETFEAFFAFMKKEQLIEPVRWDEVWTKGPDEDPEDVAVYDMEALQKQWEEMEEFSTKLISEYHNVFLTEAGYKEHMRLNGHNYRHSEEEASSYVMHAFRNPEMASLINLIKRLGSEPCKS